MLLLITLVILAAILIVFTIGGFFILLFGGAGVLFSLLDVMIGGFVLWIPIHCIKKCKKKKEVSK